MWWFWDAPEGLATDKPTSPLGVSVCRTDKDCPDCDQIGRKHDQTDDFSAVSPRQGV
ncbi:hypothetical protein Poly51_12360 [Rubripirellula tenax]|uniref:Uncharacterized protein n=1 Tax=Rubripirellula tenax TaxID=2528015 RepID=A0A5C6FAP6_9BACT|nr:hypothetical protein Poly51_12360 [Rubripirellula tenax]